MINELNDILIYRAKGVYGMDTEKSVCAMERHFFFKKDARDYLIANKIDGTIETIWVGGEKTVPAQNVMQTEYFIYANHIDLIPTK